MRAILLIPIAIALVCGAGYAACTAMGWSAHPRELLVAALTCLAAGALGVTPIVIVRLKLAQTQANVAQASLIGTMLHLMACVVVMGSVLLMKIRLAPAFTWWLMGFYFATLIALSIGLVAEMRLAAARTSVQPKQ